MDGRQIRETFLAFFEERGHKRVASASLIPPPQTGLLLTNAGMNQFIPYFLGQSQPPWPRATSVQKCFRTLDLENVGRTARHLTMFEMLGNFSFADYFKPDSLSWGYELLTEGFGLDPELLWCTHFEGDTETADIFRDLGFARERIVERGREDNYWSTHAAGPAGPTGEFFFDRGAEYGAEGGPAIDEERYMEIWNHVFMQDEVDDGEHKLGDLPGKNVDTGASVERLALVIQNKPSFFETDIMWPLLEIVQSSSGRTYGADAVDDVSLRIVAEHGRATSFLIADGVLPSNEGRGYVLRRMLRRIVSHARRIGIDEPITGRLIDATVAMLGDAYPELHENHAFATQVAAGEEERFAATLKQGMTLFEGSLPAAKGKGQISGEVAFLLHDTHGFPLELTAELAAEHGLEIDEDGFATLMAEQRARARLAGKRGLENEDVLAAVLARVSPTEFVGYERLGADTRIAGLIGDSGAAAGEGDDVRIVLDISPFYGEGGGQVGDRGLIRSQGGTVRVTDTQRAPGDVLVHIGTVESGELAEGDEVHAQVDEAFRQGTSRAHSATHIVHWTLREVLGEHARQAGSLVTAGRLRFDFTNPGGVPDEVLEQAEMLANEKLASDETVRAYETTMEYAKSQGATALFGEKYGDLVRVVEIGGYSRELCGGTHVVRTGNVAVVRILGESSIGSGMRRIEALVGPDAIAHVNLERKLLGDVIEALGGGGPEGAADRISRIIQENRTLKNELGRMAATDRASRVDELVGARESVGDDIDFVGSLVADEDADGLRELAQQTRDRLVGAGVDAVVVLGSSQNGKALLVAAVSSSLASRDVTAPKVLERAAAVVGGGAGGKAILAFAGGRRGDALDEALTQARATLDDLLAEARA